MDDLSATRDIGRSIIVDKERQSSRITGDKGRSDLNACFEIGSRRDRDHNWPVDIVTEIRITEPHFGDRSVTLR